MDFQKELGLRIRKCRNAKGYTIEELSFQSGINTSHLGKIERGESNVTLKTLGKLIECLDISYAELFDFDKAFLPPKDPLIEKTLSNLYYLTVDEKENIYHTTMLFRGQRRASEIEDLSEEEE